MPLTSEKEREIERKAMQIANSDPMSYHADSCPYLISNRRKNCRCNRYTFAQNKLRKEAGLHPVY